MGRTILGNYAPGDSAITLFAGVSARPAGFGGYGFGAVPDECDAACGGDPSCTASPAYAQCKAAQAGATKQPDWTAVGRGGVTLVSQLMNIIGAGQQQQRQQQAGFGVGYGYGSPGYVPLPTAPSATPSWLLPVGVGVGVLVLGSLVYALGSK